jgi:hypothetical protein
VTAAAAAAVNGTPPLAFADPAAAGVLEIEFVNGNMVFLSFLMDVLVVVGPVVGYVAQYRDLARSRDPRGFSTTVSLILIVANVLRVFFWHGERFEIPLLFQSFLMIAAQLALVSLCVRLAPPPR